MELSGLINLIIQLMLKDTTKVLVKKFGNKPMVKLMGLFVHQEQVEQFPELVMLLKKRIMISRFIYPIQKVLLFIII